MVECMSVTTEPPTVHRDAAPDREHGVPDPAATVATVSETRPPRLFDSNNRSKVLGVVGVVVALAFEAIAVATAMPVRRSGARWAAVLRPGILDLPDHEPARHGHSR
jgi:hypothetical protein